MVKKSYNVIPNPKGGWDVSQEGPATVLFHFEEKKPAVEMARKICRTKGTDLFIHAANGTHRVKESYSRH
jgi:hypothetical protein